jgi:hypothetical protein
MRSGRLPDLEWVTDHKQAADLLEPLRARILKLARNPSSSTELGIELSLPRQRVNYHVRELARSGLLKRAGRRRRRNMFEQLYVASARTYLLSPGLLADVCADWREVNERTSAAYLMAVSAQMQLDAGEAMRAARTTRQKLDTLSIKSQFRLENREQRERFERELASAVSTVIAQWTSPNRLSGGEPGPGRSYRLVLGCYPYVGSEPSRSAPKAAAAPVGVT